MKWFDQHSGKPISISTETIIRVIALSVGAYVLIHLASMVAHQLTLIAIAVFLAMALNPAVSWLAARLKSQSRVRATGVAYLVVLAILISFIALVILPLARQMADLIGDVPRIISEFQRQDTAVARFVREHGLDQKLGDAARDLSNRFGELGESVLHAAARVGGAIISVLIVLVLTFMMLVEGPRWYERVLALQPKRHRARRDELARRMYRMVTGYVNGQVVIGGIAAGFALVALLIASTLLGVTINAVALAGIVFVFGLIPLIGNTLAAVIVVLFSLFASPTLAIIMAIFFVVYQQIENATLQPQIQARFNQLTPLAVFMAALIGVGFGGLLGALAAIPLAGCVKILLENAYAKRLSAAARDDAAKPDEAEPKA